MINKTIDDKDLIIRILIGHKKSFEELINRYQKLVVSIVMRFTNNQYDREEVSQEIFIKVYQNLSHFRFQSKLSTWIGKVAYNHCLNYVKKNSKYAETDLIEEAEEFKDLDRSYQKLDLFENEIEKKEIHSLVIEQLNQLPKLYQTILNLFHMQEMSYAEISEILSLPEGTVKSYLFRSRKLLKEKLLSSYKEEEFIQ